MCMKTTDSFLLSIPRLVIAHSMICGPIRNAKGDIIAVIQLINKLPRTLNGGTSTPLPLGTRVVPFSQEDLTLVQCVSSAAGIALSNATLFSEVKKNSERTENMLQMLSSFTTELDTDETIDKIMSCARAILKAERVSLYLVDHEANELVCKVSQDVKGIRIPMSRGIAGHVAKTGRFENVPNVYKDKRFNPQVDIDTGFRTRCILCGPIRTANGDVVAVVQAINKQRVMDTDGEEWDRVFDHDDELLLHGIAAQAGIALTNAQLYDIEKTAHQLSRSLVETSTRISQELDILVLQKKLPNEAKQFLNAEACNVFLVDADTNELVMTDDLRMPLSMNTIPGQVVSTGAPLNISDPRSSELFDPTRDAHTGRRTRCILAVPIVSKGNSIIGVIEFINRRNADSFQDTDLRDACSLASVFASCIENARLHSMMRRYGVYVRGILGSLSASVFTLNCKGKVELCSDDLEGILGIDEQRMKEESFKSWLKLNELLALDIQKVMDTKEPILATDYELVPAEGRSPLSSPKRRSANSTSRLRSRSSLIGTMVNYKILPLELDADSTAYDMELPSAIVAGNTAGTPPSRKRRGSLFKNKNPRKAKVGGVVVMIERVSDRELMQHKVVRYKKRLNDVESELETMKNSFKSVSETPVQQVVRILSEITDRGTNNEDTDAQLAEALQLLRSPDMFTPAFMTSASTQKRRTTRRGSVLRGMIESNVPEDGNLRSWLEMAFGTNQVNADYQQKANVADGVSIASDSSSRPTSRSDSRGGSRDGTPITLERRSLRKKNKVLSSKNLDSWEFNALACNPSELAVSVHDIFSSMGLLSHFAIDAAKFHTFVVAIQDSYRPNAFTTFNMASL